MSLSILDATTLAAVRAATDQEAQLTALAAPFVSAGLVKARVYAGSTQLDEGTYPAWVIDTTTDPRTMYLGARSAYSALATGTPDSMRFIAGSTEIFRDAAGVGLSAGAGVSFAAGVMPSTAAARLSDPLAASKYRVTGAPGLPLANVPAWITSQTVNTWGTIPGATLSSADPDPGRTSAWAGASGQVAAITAWNGATHDGVGRVYLTAQGGHNDYSGNEVYVWDMTSESPTWAMLLAPSDIADYSTGAGTASAYSDGRPRSTHTYNANVWVPGLGPCLAGLPGVATPGTEGTRKTVAFSATTGAATFYSAPTTSGNGTSVAACFDATRGTQGSIWRRQHGTSLIQRWDVAADTWADVGSVQAWNRQCSLTAHPDGAYLLIGNGDPSGAPSVSGGWAVFKCADGTYHYPTFSGTVSGGLQPGECQPVWVASLGCFGAWDNATDRTRITTLTPGADPFTDAWTISYLTVGGSNSVTPSAAQGNGTYGRFVYWEAAGVFVLLNSNTETGYFFKA